MWNPFRKKSTYNGSNIEDLIKEYYTTGGVSVTKQTAMSIATFYACVKVISESIAQIPCNLMRDTGDGKETMSQDPLHYLLHYKPNDFQTSFDFRMLMMYFLLVDGNFYGFINQSNSKIYEILPITTQVDVELVNWQPVYTVYIKNEPKTIPAENILHIKGLSVDGVTGLNPIAYQRETLSLAIGNQKHGINLMQNGGRPTGVLSHPGKLNDKARENLVKSLKAMMTGSQYGRMIVTEEGSKYQPVSLSNADLQYIEMKDLGREDIASIMRVPQHMVGLLKRSTNNNIEQQALEFTKYTILPWIKNIEQVMWSKLLSDKQRQQNYYIDYNITALERADITTRYNSYRTAVTNGILSPNEIRALEGFNPRPGGDDYLSPLNMRMTDENGNVIETTFSNPTGKQKQLPESSAEDRIRIRNEYKKVFMLRGTTIVDRQVKAIRKALKDYNVKSAQSFEEWLDHYYANFDNDIIEVFKSIMLKYGKEIHKAAQKELVGLDYEYDVKQSVAEYLGNMATRMSNSSLAQLKQIIAETDPDELLDAIETRLSEWEEKTPAKIADRETHQAEGFIYKSVGVAAGITHLVWRTRGDNCKYCNTLNGKTIGILDKFVDKGSVIESSDGSTMKTYSGVSHTPAHQHCDCYVQYKLI